MIVSGTRMLSHLLNFYTRGIVSKEASTTEEGKPKSDSTRKNQALVCKRCQGGIRTREPHQQRNHCIIDITLNSSVYSHLKPEKRWNSSRFVRSDDCYESSPLGRTQCLE